MWLAYPVLLILVGLVAGAIAREVAPEPPALGDVGPWLFGLAGSVIGGLLGLLVAGADPDQDAEQWATLLLSIVGAAIGAAAFAALSGRRPTFDRRVTAQDRSQPPRSPDGSEGGVVYEA